MNGSVDESQRALLDGTVAADKDAKKEPLKVWIDTAFNGGLVIPRPQVERLGLKQASTTQAVLADGHVLDLETFTCYLDWFGKVYRTQVVANDGVSTPRDDVADGSKAHHRLHKKERRAELEHPVVRGKPDVIEHLRQQDRPELVATLMKN